jgi:multidrug efflux pump subunit AcrA (membrane-fusion protein)
MNPLPQLPRAASLLLIALLAGQTQAAFSPKKASGKTPPPTAPAPAAAPATHTVARGALKPKVQLDGVFEAAEMEPLKLSPKAWMDLTVIEAASPGTRVRKGDAVVRLDTERLRDQLEDLELDRPGSALAMELSQAELENLKTTTPLRLDAARRAQRVAAEDLAHYEQVGREQREKSTRFNLRSTENYLGNQVEELKQLEKMYKADDLTEETEEIVLKRQRFEVERAQFSLENARISTERELSTLMAREQENQRNAKRDQDIALAYTEQTLPRTLSKKQLEFEKSKRDQRKSEKRFNDLKADLEAMNVKAPIDGVVYYGACQNGRWTTAPAVLPKLAPGGKLMPNEVFITIVNPDRLRIKAVVPETELAKLSEGMRGQCAPTAGPDKKLQVRVEEVGTYPLPTGGFEAVLSYESAEATKLVPGMTCKVFLGDGQRPNTLVVPKDAVFSDGASKVVYVAKDGAKPEKRAVKAGDSDDASTEIIEGVTEGEKVLLKRPE